MASDALTDLERTVVDAIDADRLAADVARLVRIPSWNGEETPAQEWMAEAMAAVGLATDIWEIDLDAVLQHPAASTEIERTKALGVVGSLEGEGGGPTLLLNGHVDVVPPGDASLWRHPPFSGVIEDGRVVGRGALDMKGQLVAGLHAVAAVAAHAPRMRGTVRLVSVVGEEDGGIGTLASILRGYRGDGAIVLEPTGGAIAAAQAGCLNFRIRVPGKAAHGAVRTEGVSAIAKLLALHGAVEALEARRNERLGGDPLFAGYDLPFPISIGTVGGGEWASSVADGAWMAGRMGVAPGEPLDTARTEMETAVAEAAAKDDWLAEHPPRVEWWGGRFLPARTDEDDPLVAALAGSAAAARRSGNGVRPEVVGMPFGADMGLLCQVAQTPTVMFGAGDIREAHRPNESMEIEALVALARALAVTILRYCE